MAKKFDVVASVGEYTNQQGETKKRFFNMGAAFETDKGLSIKIESIPVGWNGWANLYPPKDTGGKPAETQPAKAAPANDDPDDSLPF